MERVMRERAATAPVIVFLDTKTKAHRVVKICKTLKITCDLVTTDEEFEKVLSLIRKRTSGVVAAIGKYGRGADIRFATDSYVVIGYLPTNMDQVRQFTGRSSRTMQVHNSLVVCIDKEATPRCIKERLDNNWAN